VSDVNVIIAFAVHELSIPDLMPIFYPAFLPWWKPYRNSAYTTSVRVNAASLVLMFSATIVLAGLDMGQNVSMATHAHSTTSSGIDQW